MKSTHIPDGIVRRSTWINHQTSHSRFHSQRCAPIETCTGALHSSRAPGWAIPQEKVRLCSLSWPGEMNERRAIKLVGASRFLRSRWSLGSRAASSPRSDPLSSVDSPTGSSLARNIRMVVIDFDETCTKEDAVGPLFDVCLERALKDVSQDQAEEFRQKREAAARDLSELYFSNLRRLHNFSMASMKQQQEYGGTCLADATRSVFSALNGFEPFMVDLVVQSRVLAGARREDVAGLGQRVPLQEGCAHTLARLQSEAVPLYVLSLNWSTALIQATFAHAGVDASPQGMQVIANELEYGSDGVSTGGIICRVQCPKDKDLEFQAIQRRHSSQSKGASVYVGDSVTDLPALMGADFGIVVGGSTRLREVLSGARVELVPLQRAPTSSNACAMVTRALYHAQSWEEIRAFLFDPPSPTTSPGPSSNQASGRTVEAGAEEEEELREVRRGGVDRDSTIKTEARIETAVSGRAETNREDVIPSKDVIGDNILNKDAIGDQILNKDAIGDQIMNKDAIGDQILNKDLIEDAVEVEVGASGASPRCLTVAGTDSGGGAGVQADLKAFLGNGVFGMSVITSVTAQNTRGVQGVHVVPVQIVEQQLSSVLGDLGADSLKTGMLPTPEIILAVCDKIREFNIRNVVVDPVLVATSGCSLSDSTCIPVMKENLFPLATIITPNTTEASALLGGRPVADVHDMEEAAVSLHAFGSDYVLVKGGHLVGSSSAKGTAVDVLYDGREFFHLSADVVDTKHTHGTGCTLASTIAAYLARGYAPNEAVATGKAYITSLLEVSKSISHGTGVQKPMSHEMLIQPKQGLSSTLRPPTSPNPCDLRCYGVTDPLCNEKCGRTMLEAVKLAVAGGATIIQLREKDLDARKFVELAREVLTVARPLRIPVIINDRVDVAIASGADGVHVGQSDIDVLDVRAMLGPHKIIGVSVGTVNEAVYAEQNGADYLGAGGAYPTGTKADANCIGLSMIGAICAAVGIPVVAIGGIKLDNAAELIAVGADGVAVVSGIFAADDPERACSEFLQIVDEALSLRETKYSRSFQS